MPTLPSDIIPFLVPFAPLFSPSVFEHILVLFGGAILTPGKRTVTSCLRAAGLSQESQFQKYHRVFNRDRWSPLKAAEILLRLLVQAFAPSGPVVLGIDETITRRWGPRIQARGIYRDAARSSKEFFVKCSGLRWFCVMLLTPVGWSKRIWALPFLSVLAPSEKYHEKRHLRHKKLTDWARESLLQIRRWLPDRPLIVVADGGYAVLELLDACAKHPNPITMITPLRLDAALYEVAPF